MPPLKFLDRVAPVDIRAALAALNGDLDSINGSERRKDRLLGFARSVVGNLLALALLLIAFMRYRGLT